MSVPASRQLATVLQRLHDQGGGARVSIATVAAVPNSRQVQIDVGGTLVVVPKLSSYVPVVGEPVYLLVGDTTMLALGTVK